MLATFALVGALAVAGQSPASWVVLVKSDGSVPASWNDRLQNAVKTAADSSSSVKWVPPPQVSLEDAQLALGCSSWGPGCVGQIAGMMNADAALVLEFEKRGKGAWLSWQVVRNSGKPKAKPARMELPDRGAKGLDVARAVAASAVSGKPVTVVTITTDVAGAEVFIDGEKAGKTPMTLAGKLSPGAHRIELRMEGRAPVTQNVDVKAGALTKVGAVMTAAAMQAPDDPVVGEPLGDPLDDPPPELQDVKDGEPAGDAFSLSPLFSYATVGVGLAVAAVGGGLYAGHLLVGLNAQPRPCTDPAQLEVPAADRRCESQQEAYERIAAESEDVNATMDALYNGMIIAEVAAGVIVLAGAGLFVVSLLTDEE